MLCRGVSIFDNVFFFLVDEGEGGSKYHYLRAIIGPPAKRHLNGVLAMPMMTEH